jgi:hypothetical protein
VVDPGGVGGKSPKQIDSCTGRFDQVYDHDADATRILASPLHDYSYGITSDHGQGSQETKR